MEKAPLKYGQIRGGNSGFVIDITDAQYIKAASGRFMKRNATTGKAEVLGASDGAVVIGWMEWGGDDTSTSSKKGWIVNDLSAVFRIPLAYDASSYTVNYSIAIKGETCDVVVVSNTQYANPTDASTGHMIIVGGLAATGTTLGVYDGYLDVMLNDAAMLRLGVGA